MKFRILQLVHNVAALSNEDGRYSIEYIIQKKTFWGWKEIFSHEIKSHRISHKTFEDAESYMMANYMGHGMCTINGNVYTYEPYTYYM